MSKKKQVLAAACLTVSLGVGLPNSALAAGPTATQVTHYQVQQIRPTSGRSVAYGEGLTSSGAVLASDGTNAFVIQGKSAVQLARPTGMPADWQFRRGAINDKVQVVGSYEASNFFSAPSPYRYAGWSSPSATPEVGCSACSQYYEEYASYVHMNSSGYVAVSWMGHGGPHVALVSPAGTLGPLPDTDSLGTSFLQATGLSDKNEICGWAWLNNSRGRAFDIQNGQARFLDALDDSTDVRALAMSPSGKYIVGIDGTQAIEWGADRKPRALKDLPSGFTPTAVNDNGDVVGTVSTTPWILRKGYAGPLAGLVDAPKALKGSSLCDVTQINARGQVLVGTCDSKQNTTGLLLASPKK